jgi:hypothetical protein
VTTAPEPVRGRLLDLEYQIEVPDAALADYLRTVYRDSLDDDITDPEVFRVQPSPSGGFVVTVDGNEVDTPARAPWALSSLVWHLNRRVVACSRRPVLLHAGAAVFGGRAVLVVGKSGAGKTTTIAALVRSGGAYLTDDVVAVGADGTLTGAAKPIGLRHPSPALLGLAAADVALPPDAYRADASAAQVHLAASSLGGGAGGASLARTADPGLVVFLDEDLPPGEVEELRRSQCVARITEYAFDLDQRGVPGFEALTALARRSSAMVWARGSLGSILDVVDRALTATTLRET